jgi:glycosyltransferase involved in cell wall biosynthesis
MAALPKYSIVIPVYNRPDELSELLASLTKQAYTNFEVIVVDDGSTISCREVTDQFQDELSIQYIFKPNTGPGPSRNVGFTQARGEYFVVFDSDCIIPPHYLKVVDEALTRESIDAWGGPDKAHTSFTAIQQAMGYTMSSVLTTGGIRGGKKHIGWFQPRSFNMGISRKVFEQTGGFKFDRFAEDIELSIRIKNAGFRSVLINEAFVYHKRRTNLKQFYHQVSNFGRGRVLVGSKHRGGIKITHLFPSFFTLGLFVIPVLFALHLPLALITIVGYGAYFVAIGIHGYLLTNQVKVAILCMPAAGVQLIGYGMGFINQVIKTYIKK